MKLGFVSAIVPELFLEEVLTFAPAEGFSCIEAMCWPTGKAERKFEDVVRSPEVHGEGQIRNRALK